MAVDSKLRPGTPEEAGMSGEGLERAASLLADAVHAGQITAASLVVARRGTLAFSRGFGKLRPEEGSPAVQPDTVFLLASITKAVTASAMMLLVERGQVSLDDPACQYLPDFTEGERKSIRVRHLLSHTSGMPDMLPENIDLRRAHAPLSEFVRLAQKTPLLYPPNTGFRYQSMGILLAAEIVERVTGKRLRDFEEEEIFGPLGMKNSALGLGSHRIPETVWCGTGMSETEDQVRFGPNSPYWRDLGNPWGGMHSTGPDLAVLLQTLLNGGTYAGRRVFSAASAREMTTDQNRGLNAPWGVGWALGRSRVWHYCGELVSPRTFGHSGATGTVAWADPERDLICVILTNQMVAEGSLLRRVSNAVSSAVCESF